MGRFRRPILLNKIITQYLIVDNRRNTIIMIENKHNRRGLNRVWHMAHDIVSLHNVYNCISMYIINYTAC